MAARTVWAMACLVLLAGCTAAGRSVVAEVDAAGWSDPVELILPNDDTLGCYDWQLFVRCDDRFAAQEFTLRLTVLTPDSLRFEEPFAVRVPATAAPAAVMREIAVEYRRRVQLGRTGNYRIRIRPQQPLQGVEAVGIQCVKSN